MKTYEILLIDFALGKIEEKVGDVIIQGNKKQTYDHLKKRLKELIKGYVVDEKPKIGFMTFKDGEKKIKSLVAQCDSDYGYLIPLLILK